MKEEKIKEILDTDFRSEEGKQKIQEILHKIKPLSKYVGEVPLEKVEKLIGLLSRKYNVGVSHINLASVPNNVDIYNATLCIFKPYKELRIVYGCCIYELYAKIAIALYDVTRKMSEV